MLDADDFQEEIRAHLKIAADEKVADGADPTRATLESLKDFSNVTLTTEAARRGGRARRRHHRDVRARVACGTYESADCAAASVGIDDRRVP